MFRRIEGGLRALRLSGAASSGAGGRVCLVSWTNWCLGHPLVGGYVIIKRRRRNLYLLPSYSLRLLALPFSVGRQHAEAHARICNRRVRPRISTGPKAWRYITTGIYRCSILDMNMKFCENFDKSRISADKRFQMYVKTTSRLAQPPNRGFCVAVCGCKDSKFLKYKKLSRRKWLNFNWFLWFLEWFRANKMARSVHFGNVLLYLCLKIWNVGFYYFFYKIITNGVVSMN